MSERRGRGTEKSQKNSSRATREQGFEILARERNMVYLVYVYRDSGKEGETSTFTVYNTMERNP